MTSIILCTPLHNFTSATTPLAETLSIIFPHNTWLITVIHLSILSAIIGTIHSMLWSASCLLVSLVNLMRGHVAKSMVSRKFFTPKIAIALVGSCIFLSFSTITNIDLFFNLTAIFLVVAYSSAMVTLLGIPDEWRSGQNIKTCLGLLAALMIFIFAFDGLINSTH